MENNTHVVVSTGSGTGKASEVWETSVKPQLDGKQHPYQVHFTTSEHSISQLTKDIFLPRANDGVAQAILLMSGDGGIVDIVNSLLSGGRELSAGYKKPTIAVIPLGTGNALAHSIGVADVAAGLETFFKGTPKDLPFFCAHFSYGAKQLYNEGREERDLHLEDGRNPVVYGAVVCSWGLHAGLVADSDTTEYRKFGAERFKMAAKEALYPSDGSQPHVYKGKVTFLRSDAPDDDPWQIVREGEHAYVLATMVSHLEQDFNISPHSEPLDGKLRLVHFGPMTGDAAMEVMGKAYQGGQHVEDARVGYEEIVGFRIEFKEKDARWRRVCIDGKIIQVEEGGVVEVQADEEGVVDLLVK